MCSDHSDSQTDILRSITDLSRNHHIRPAAFRLCQDHPQFRSSHHCPKIKNRDLQNTVNDLQKKLNESSETTDKITRELQNRNTKLSEHEDSLQKELDDSACTIDSLTRQLQQRNDELAEYEDCKLVTASQKHQFCEDLWPSMGGPSLAQVYVKPLSVEFVGTEFEEVFDFQGDHGLLHPTNYRGRLVLKVGTGFPRRD